MGDIFGGKLTAGIFGIVGLFVGVIMIGIMAGPFGSLVAYFDDGAEFSTGSNKGSKYQRVYTGVVGDTDPTAFQINIDTNRAGGSGYSLSDGGALGVKINTGATVLKLTDGLYNEQGQSVGFGSVAGVPGTVCTASACYLDKTTMRWKEPPEAFNTLSFLNSILVALLALVASIGLIVKTKSAYDSFKTGGVGLDLGKTVLMEVVTFVLGLVGVYFAPPLLTVIANTAVVYTSGQFDFSFVASILKIVYSIIPTMVIIGIMGLVSGAPTGKLVGAVTSRVGNRFGGFRKRRGMAY